jgi:carbonic anhydrase/acetyltransferase-like protein (isoleucine patch superfamily)
MSLFRLDDEGPDVPADCWVAPNATVLGRVRLGSGASVWFGAVIRGDNEPIRIGAGTNIQDNCVLHSDPGAPLTIGAGCTIGHRAIVHGCTVGDNTLIGMGAIVLNRAVIGRNCLIGAGALVPEGKIIPDGSLVIGVPGRVSRALTPEEIEGLAASARHYAANGRRFAAGLSPA